MRYIGLLLAIVLGAWGGHAHAYAPALQADEGLRAAVRLDGRMEWLSDPTASLEIADVVARGAQFTPATGLQARGFSREALWLRITLARAADAAPAWDLSVSPTFLDEVELFVPDGGGSFERVTLGDRMPYADRPVDAVKFVFPLHLDVEPTVFYLRVRSTSALIVQAELWQREGLLRARALADVSVGLALGAIGAMFLFNIVFWLWLRERVQFYYAAYLATMAAQVVVLEGYAARWLFRDMPGMADHGVGVILGLNCMAAILFFCHAMDMPRTMPAAFRGFLGLACFFVAVVLVSLMGQYRFLAGMVNIVAIVTAVLGVLMPAILLRRGYRSNFLYLLAFMAFAISALPMLLRIHGIRGMDALAEPLMSAGTVLHLVLLNIALVHRVRQAELDHRRQRRAALAAALEAERVLELKVSQRTLSLQAEVERRTALEQQLRSALDTEKLALAEQRRFVAMVSHEFRTPLAVIHATTHSLGLTPGAQEPRIRERVDKIGRAAGRLSAMLDNYLTEDRLSMERLQLQPRPVDLRELVEELVRVSLRDESGGRLHIESDGQPLRVSCDPGLSSVAISNLVQNALKYAPPDTPVTLRLAAREGRAVIEVEDAGAGIAPEDEPHIFAKYFRAEAAGRLPGTGLGLYLARAIATAQGGEVQLVRTSFRGSVFRFALPLMVRPESIEN